MASIRVVLRTMLEKLCGGKADEDLNFLVDIARHTTVDPINGKTKALKFQKIFNDGKFGFAGTEGVARKGVDKRGDRIITNMPKMAFENSAIGGVIYIIYNIFVFASQTDGGKKTIFKRCKSGWVFSKNIVHHSADDFF